MKHTRPLLICLCLAGFIACSMPSDNGVPEPPPEPGPVYAAPEKPEASGGDCLIAVTWKRISTATGYELYYGTSPRVENAGKWTGDLIPESLTVSALLNGLEEGTRYYVWVRALYSGNVSDWSERAFTATVPPDYTDNTAEPRLFFDYGRRISSNDDPTVIGTYTVPQGKTLVLTPVRWELGSLAAWQWTVDGVEQAGAAGEYFSFTPPGAPGEEYLVSVRANNGNNTFEARTKVRCEAPEGTYRRPKTGTSQANAVNGFEYMPAPGQFTGLIPLLSFTNSATEQSVRETIQSIVSSPGVNYKFSLGDFGGYLITGFDHSVDNVPGEYSFSIKGNAFSGWEEPSVVWVSRDDNGDGLPNDSWYELKGSAWGTPGMVQRYAITYYRPISGNSGLWRDNEGTVESYPRRYPFMENSRFFTFTGTKITNLGDGTHWGYVDIVDPERFRISDAVQADGTPANLAYIDFIKIQCASREMTVFGEKSTETGVPFDLSMDNPALLIQGKAIGGGAYTYTFINTSGYDLTVVIEGQTLELYRDNNTPQTVTLAKAEVYFAYWGGNVTFSASGGTVSFRM